MSEAVAEAVAVRKELQVLTFMKNNNVRGRGGGRSGRGRGRATATTCTIVLCY